MADDIETGLKSRAVFAATHEGLAAHRDRIIAQAVAAFETGTLTGELAAGYIGSLWALERYRQGLEHDIRKGNRAQQRLHESNI